MDWINVDDKLPEDAEVCEIIVDFKFVSVSGGIIVEELMTSSNFEGIYNKKDNNWIIIKGVIPNGFLTCKVIKWVPLNVSKEKEFSIKDMILKAIAKDMHDDIKKEICKDLKENQKEMIVNARSEYPNWFKLNAEQEDIVKKIAAEFPYRIELVSGIFIEQKFSEEKTREILIKRLVTIMDIKEMIEETVQEIKNADNKILELLSEEVHDAWMKEKRDQGFHSPDECQSKNHKGFLNTNWKNQERLTDNCNVKFYKWCDKCHTDLYPYNELPENIKEYDRVTVRTVLEAMGKIKSYFGIPKEDK